MLSSLGKLNSELLTAYYGPSAPSTRHVEHMLKSAQSLYKKAQRDAHQAVNQDRFDEEEHGLTHQAVWARHVAKHTFVPNTLCSGPCVHLTHQDINSILPLLEDIGSEKHRPRAVNQLASRLASMTPTSNPLNPRMCEKTGVPCVVFRVDRNRDSDAIESPPPQRSPAALQVLKEAKHTLEFAKLVASSQVRELDAGERKFERMEIDLKGGGRREANPEAIRDFFKMNQLGDVPDTGDIRVALDSVTSQIAPRARDSVKIDLWSKWMHL
jgi:hypothetical protein